MSSITVGPTGNVIRGHVLDCAEGPLQARLKKYDPQLYVRWNPKKLSNWGCWELRRRPEFKSVRESFILGGYSIARLEYVENDFESHILDVPYLNYKLLDKVAEIDTWNKSYKAKHFGADLEAREADAQAQIAKKAAEDKDYALKQHKTMIRDLMDYVQSGGNPYKIADFWK